MYGGLIAALLIAFFFTMIAVVAFRRKGPWGTAWTFFLVMFLVLWTVSLYMRAVGPVYWGIAWLPLIFAGLLLATLLLAIVPVIEQSEDRVVRDTDSGRPKPSRAPDAPAPTASRIFWILILLLVVAIVIGMVNPQPAK